MTERRAELFTSVLFAVVIVAVAACLTIRLLRVDPVLFGSALEFDCGVLMVGVIAWALLHNRVATALFRPRYDPDAPSASVEPRQLPGSRTIGHFLVRGPRWLLPCAGSVVLLVLFLLYAIGFLPVSVAFAIMAALVIASLLLGSLIQDVEAEDRRADMPLGMTATWAILYLGKTGLGIELLAALSWPAFIVGACMVLMRSYPWKWIPIGFVVLVMFNLVVFFAFWRA